MTLPMASYARFKHDLMTMAPHWYDPSNLLIGLDASVTSTGLCISTMRGRILAYFSSCITRMGPILDTLGEHGGKFVVLSEYVPHMKAGMARAHQAAVAAIEDDIKNTYPGRVKLLRINPDTWHKAMLGVARNTKSEPSRLKERSIWTANTRLKERYSTVTNDDEADSINICGYLQNQMEYFRKLRNITTKGN